MNAETDEEVFQSVPDHILEAAMVVLAHVSLVKQALWQQVVDQTQDRASLGFFGGLLVQGLLGRGSLLWEVVVLKLMLPLVELVLNLGNLARYLLVVLLALTCGELRAFLMLCGVLILLLLGRLIRKDRVAAATIRVVRND